MVLPDCRDRDDHVGRTYASAGSPRDGRSIPLASSLGETNATQLSNHDEKAD